MPTETEEQKVAAEAKATEEKAKSEEIKRAEDKSLDKFPPELQEHIRELRAENKKRREREEALSRSLSERDTKLKEYEKADEARNRAKLEEEKKYQELAESERKKREEVEAKAAEKLRSRDVAVIRQELKSYAKDLGIIDPDDVKSIDIRDMRVTDEGDVPGAKEAVEALKAAKPHWFKAEDDKSKRGEHKVVTPTRKDNASGQNWATASDKEVSSELRRYGVTA